ncbi:uncharacterized protein LOC106134906 [Amyelois transitella]|uniref:uncharacterized protein LOC106134906 n=1 Tax=Amyelois transitella TaxID=680683 RepID=UPI00298F4E4A|nr:uncharacterized protein LOC106134906 [Amyelois transitella]
MTNLALPDLDVRTVLNVVEENFEKVELKAYAVRMIYIGEHTMCKEDMIKHFKKTVNAVNACYCEVNIQGLLLVYDSYFIHVLEGSEDTVHRQLRFLFKEELDWIEEMDRLEEEEAAAAAEAAEAEAIELGIPYVPPPAVDPAEKPERKMFKRLKLLIVYHSIKTRWFSNWQAVTARPPSLVGKLDVYGPLQAHMEQLRICLDKIFKLCRFANEEHLSFEGLSAVDPRMEALPEVALLDFLIQSQYIFDLRQFAYMHRRVDDYCFYFESVWPLPTHYTPRHLYKLKIDDSFVEPLPVMPWEMVKKEVGEDEEGREEQQSGSSDSD